MDNAGGEDINVFFFIHSNFTVKIRKDFVINVVFKLIEIRTCLVTILMQ